LAESRHESRPSIPEISFTKGSLLARAVYKSVWSVRETPDVVILMFDQKAMEPDRILNELKLYSELGKLGLSPKILYVYHHRLQSFDEFVQSPVIDKNTEFMVERHQCGDDGLDSFKLPRGFDGTRYFKELNPFLFKLQSHGYYNLDSKSENLCYQSGFSMIDLDYVRPSSDPHDAIYMIFLVFITLRNAIGPQHVSIQQTGISSRQYDRMLEYVHTTSMDDKVNRVERICFYAYGYHGVSLDDEIAKGSRGVDYLKQYKNALFHPGQMAEILKESSNHMKLHDPPKSYMFGYVLAAAFVAAYAYTRGGYTRKKRKKKRTVRAIH
jgi:hypothetical protein